MPTWIRGIVEGVGWGFIAWVVVDYLLSTLKHWKYGSGTLKDDHGYGLIKIEGSLVGVRWIGSDKLHVFYWLPFRWYRRWSDARG